MAQPSLADRLAVCSWSLQPPTPAALVEALKRIGIDKVQLALDPIREGGAWGNGGKALAAAGIGIVSGMVTTVGEDYSTMDAIRRTGGVVPDATWPATWSNLRQMAPIAADLGIELVTFHAGFLPEDPHDPTYEKLMGRIQQVADLFSGLGIALGFETGQEDAATLDEFLHRLGRDDVGVNFDPANMILYDKGDPIQALRTLAPRLKQCHIKDAIRTKTPGQWGEEVATGTGQVDWPAFFRVLDEVGYTGALAIEREAGNQREADIKTAKEYVSKLS